MANIKYQDWNPGLKNQNKTLEEIQATLPANSPEDISKIVKLLENPDSPLALKGAVSLERHDAIHIILGRGLLPQDEAFVIGFTMGTSKDISRLEEFIFKTASVYLYPKKYRFTKRHMKSYDLGLKFGKECSCEKIYEFPFEEHHKTKLKKLREMIGLDIKKLTEIYEEEKLLLPNTKVSKRLNN